MTANPHSDGIVIIPTYNEIENIRAIIMAVTGLEKALDVLIIDDGSPDGTARVVRELMQGPLAGRLHLIERKGKLGLGTAYIRGFEWAIGQGYVTGTSATTLDPKGRAMRAQVAVMIHRFLTK